MLNLVDLIDYIDNEIARLGESDCITPVGQSSTTGAITALKQIRSFIEKKTSLVQHVDQKEEA